MTRRAWTGTARRFRQRGVRATADRPVMVTGAAGGIGAAICQHLAVLGVALLVHTSRNEAGVRRVADADVKVLGQC